MKYTIEGFGQQFASTLKKKTIKNNKEVEIKIDCTDLVILRWFVDFYPNMKKMVVDGKEYAWLTHKKLMEDLPLVDISRAGFIARMQKLVEFNVLQYKFVKEGGSFSLYTFGDNYYNLISDGGVCSNTHGVDVQTYTGVHTQTYTKDNNIIDESIKDIKETINRKESKHKHGEYGHVLLTDTQVEKLNADYGDEATKEAIKFLDEWIQEKGYKSKEHNLALRRWVFNAIKKAPIQKAQIIKGVTRL